MTATVSLTREAIDRIIEDHFQQEAAGDVDGTLSTFTDDVVHDVVGDPAGELHGPSAVGHRYGHLFSNVKGEHADVKHRLYGENFVVDDMIWTARVRVPRRAHLAGERLDRRRCGHRATGVGGGSAVKGPAGTKFLGSTSMPVGLGSAGGAGHKHDLAQSWPHLTAALSRGSSGWPRRPRCPRRRPGSTTPARARR